MTISKTELVERLRRKKPVMAYEADGSPAFDFVNPDGPEAADFIEQSISPDHGVREAREIIELYFAPWGAAKGERWEDISGDQPFEAEVALRLVLTVLNKESGRG